MNRLYTPAPDGYCGDEDNGQTSAWYVFSAMGFYPVCPGVDQYVVGAPLFKKITIQLENGKQVNILAPDNNAENRYIGSMKMNGKEYSKNWLSYKALMQGCTLDIEMTALPNKLRGIAKEDFPYSFSNEEVIKVKNSKQ